MWDILLQAAAAFVVGAAVGYGFAAIVEALSRAFANLWQHLVTAANEIFGYLRDATKYYLALIAQFLDNNWSGIESYLRQEFGYRNEWLIGIFRDGLDVLIAIADPKQQHKDPVVFSITALDTKQQAEVQLPTSQNPLVTVLNV
ncbi:MULTISPECIES: hypothetical protein [Nostocales]|uniref:Uncharacterized protein n=1 Tax=Aphanizomenon flos-aquae FACHB-1040 TaxID=2692887 RepID=A0ABR8BW89_APHFL|nr:MULTISPECIES: hypothetical protein [Nostocales]ALB42143.1 hypothetical protein AA650_18290 [Anabaena sp. WA102]MBD2279193.1 hypothetical protein [Aphanizomenon flos-aquae FACHB-1040]